MKNTAKKQKHEHFWFTPYSVWQGSRENESIIARYCDCGEIQIARVRSWKKADRKTKVYPDIIEECQQRIAELKPRHN